MESKQIAALEEYYKLNYDKWYRMAGSTATTLLGYRDHTIYLRIIVGPACTRSARNLAEHHAFKRREALRALADATHYRATIYWHRRRYKNPLQPPETADDAELIDQVNQRLAQFHLPEYYRTANLSGSIPHHDRGQLQGPRVHLC